MISRIIVRAIGFATLNVPAVVDVSLRAAYLKGADAKVTYRVVDDVGVPVEGATAHVWFRTTYPKLIIEDWVTRTDSNGMFIAMHRTNDRLSCGIDKEGYYHSFDRITFSDPRAYPLVTDGRWQPYGNMRTVVLKKIKVPCKLQPFPYSLRSCRIPEFGKWIGFDFECCEWIAPYGKGRYADVLLRFSTMRKQIHEYRYVMDVSFTNNPYAGVYQMKADKSSDFTTTYNADSNAIFKATFSYVKEQIPGSRRHWNILDGDSYLVFRTRTRIDEHGKLVGAYYGKILGEWFSEEENMVLSDGCFNPVENDVNIEDGSCLRDVLRNQNKKTR